jgi:hypothetical protein
MLASGRSQRRPALALTALLLVGSEAAWSAPSDGPGIPIVPEAERTEAGQWEGTWYYVSRIFRMAIWMRSEAGRPQLRIRYFSMGTTESFATDWDGHATYEHRGLPGEFTLQIDEADRNSIRGSWRWTLGSADSGRIETTRFTMFRAGDGRQFVLKLEDYKRVYRGAQERSIEVDQIWAFRKASRREALWAELPF